MTMVEYLDGIDRLARRRAAAVARHDFRAVIGCAADLTCFLIAKGGPFAPQDQRKTLVDLFMPPLPTMQNRD
jgi:hypothetical protein